MEKIIEKLVEISNRLYNGKPDRQYISIELDDIIEELKQLTKQGGATMINNQVYNVFVFFVYTGETTQDLIWIARNMPKITPKQAQNMVLVAEWVKTQLTNKALPKEKIFKLACKDCEFLTDIKTNFLEK